MGCGYFLFCLCFSFFSFSCCCTPLLFQQQPTQKEKDRNYKTATRRMLQLVASQFRKQHHDGTQRETCSHKEPQAQLPQRSLPLPYKKQRNSCLRHEARCLWPVGCHWLQSPTRNPAQRTNSRIMHLNHLPTPQGTQSVLFCIRSIHRVEHKP
jgi:hypothetical protein